MKKYVLLVAIVLMFPLVASAQTTDSTVDLQALIQQLQAQIQSLQAQVTDLQAEVQSVKLELKFSRSLTQGATGDDVKQLQEFLKTFTGSYPNGLITGYFGPLTATAVKKFQEQNGIESVGIVGPKTQAKLNMLVTAIPGTPAVPAPGTVISPASTSIFTGLKVSLASNNPFGDALIPLTNSAVASVPVLAVNLTAGNGSIMTVSELKFHENGWFPDSSISDAYLVENGKVLYKYSSVSDGIINFGGLSLSVAAGQTRTIWLVIDITSNLSVGNNVSFGLNAASDVTARDASNNSVSASGLFPMVGNWFMATSTSNLSPAPAPPVTTPSATAIPATPATLCETPVGVQIKPDVVTVLSPNGEKQWQVGGTYTIKYSTKDTVGNKALLIYLEKGYDAPTTKTGANSSLLIGVTTNLESYTYTVPSNIQSYPGLGNNYKITIMVEGSYFSCDRISYSGDSSDAEFSIIAGQYNIPAATSTTTTPTTTTISPTSGVGYGSQTGTATTTATQTTQNNTATLSEQISALQNKLNTTTDTATRDSLTTQIIALKAQVTALQSSTPTTTSTTTTTPTTAGTATTTTISGTTTTTTATSAIHNPSVIVLSPNGGETLTTGKIYEIKWTGGNNTVDVSLLDNSTRLGKKIFSGITNNNYVSWTVSPLSSNDLLNPVTNTYTTPSGQYVIFVGCTDNNCTVDNSDSYFKIVE